LSQNIDLGELQKKTMKTRDADKRDDAKRELEVGLRNLRAACRSATEELIR
jgi:hypothetical protein